MKAFWAMGVLACGVAALGYWASHNDAPRIEAKIAAAADDRVAGALHGVTTQVTGRDIILSGLVDSEDERASLLAQLQATPGRRVVRDQTTRLASQSPYRTQIIYFPSGELRLSGSVPREAWRDTLKTTVPFSQDTADLASGAPADWPDIARAASLALFSLNEGQVVIEDRTLTVEGVAETPTTLAALREVLETGTQDVAFNLDGVRLLDDGLPVAVQMSKGPDGFRAVGKLPQGVSRADLADALGAASLDGDAAPGRMGASEGPAVLLGAEVLSRLEVGTLDYTDGHLRFQGQARDPSALAALRDTLSVLPDLYSVDLSAVTVRDDGRPPAFELILTPDMGGQITGKLPEGIDTQIVADLLGLSTLAGTASPGLTGAQDGPPLRAVLNALRDSLALSEAVTLLWEAGQAQLQFTTRPGVDPGRLQSSLQDMLADSATVDVLGADQGLADGTPRDNRLTGQSERFAAGHWLPVLSFQASLTTCRRLANDTLAEAKVNFVTGSAELDPYSLTVINRIAAIAERCVVEAGLSVEVGGHTDNTGDALANYRLSVARARAVRDALVARGVPPGALQAVGHGQTEPIATNETAQGRAANRRTTLLWR